MDNFTIIALMIGILIGYFISLLDCDSVIKNINVTHPAAWS